MENKTFNAGEYLEKGKEHVGKLLENHQVKKGNGDLRQNSGLWIYCTYIHYTPRQINILSALHDNTAKH